jgi:hypothetical protein
MLQKAHSYSKIEHTAVKRILSAEFQDYFKGQQWSIFFTFLSRYYFAIYHTAVRWLEGGTPGDIYCL